MRFFAAGEDLWMLLTLCGMRFREFPSPVTWISEFHIFFLVEFALGFVRLFPILFDLEELEHT